MKIILKKDVQGLGYKDDILVVKDGYGRNYLLPQRLAVLATDKAIKAVQEELKQRAHKLAKIKADAEAKAKQFEGVSLVIEAKVSDGMNIYGSVGAAQMGITIDPKQVTSKSVKVLGQHIANIELHKEVIIELPFEVIPDADSKKAAEEYAAQKKADKEKANAKVEEEKAEAAEEATEAPAEA